MAINLDLPYQTIKMDTRTITIRQNGDEGTFGYCKINGAYWVIDSIGNRHWMNPARPKTEDDN